MRILPSICPTRLLIFSIALPASAWAATPLFPKGDFSAGMNGWNLLCMKNTRAVAEVKEIENRKHAVSVGYPADPAAPFLIGIGIPCLWSNEK